MPISSFFGGLGNQVRRFAGQAYSAADRAVGGVLPGGSDNPYIGSSRPYFVKQPTSKQPSLGGSGMYGTPSGTTAVTPGIAEDIGSTPFHKDVEKLTNTMASSIANIQPAIKTNIKNSPGFVRNIISSGLNQLPVSANLFARYYTGLGGEGLHLPSSFIEEIRPQIEATKKVLPEQTRFAEEEVKVLNSLSRTSKNKREMYNDSLAEAKSSLNQLKSGNIPVYQYMSEAAQKANPLSSTATSLGSAWFTPTTEGGWKTKEKYDFMYGGADKKGPYGVTKSEINSPSEEFATAAAQGFLNIFANDKKLLRDEATSNPLTHFGRSVVAKMDPSSFEYDVNIPPKN